MSESVKVQLLNDGEYCGLEDVHFPVEVLAIKREDLWYVPTTELVRIGANPEDFDRDLFDPQWPFEDETEAVRVEDS